VGDQKERDAEFLKKCRSPLLYIKVMHMDLIIWCPKTTQVKERDAQFRNNKRIR
jgi:hypothetical protein